MTPFFIFRTISKQGELMKTNLDMFKNDSVCEEQGIEFEVRPGVSFILRRFGGKNANKVKQSLAKHYKPYARLLESGKMEENEEKKIMIKVFVESCLVSWKGIEADGKELECNLENAVKLFMELPELFDLLYKHANDTENYREDLGNF